MPTIVHGFDWPDRVVVGTVGQPGSRSFYLQARSGSRITSVALEKEQSAVLAEKIEEILDELRSAEGNPLSIPDTTPLELIDNDPLEQPVEPAFRTGTMSLGWDPSTLQVVIEAFPIVEVEIEVDDSDGGDFDNVFDDDLPGIPDVLRVEPEEMMLVRIPVGTARAFAKRTLEIVGAGRPLCPLCGTPVDPEGHTCALPGGFSA